MKQISRFDWLRAFGSFMIVGCHLIFSLSPASVLGVLRNSTDVFVGIFGMIAGFFMCLCHIQKKQTAQTFAVQRVRRLVIPYLVWSVCFVGANCLFDSLRQQPLTFELLSAKAWGEVLLLGAAGPHTWFLIALFYGQMLLFWPVRNWVKTDFGWVPFVVLGLCALTITVKCSGQSTAWSGIGIYHIRLLAYLALGIALGCQYPRIQRLASRYPAVVHAAWGVWLIGSCILFKWMTGVNGFWLAALLAVPVFVWALIGSNRTETQNKTIQQVASVSMGIYCIHPVFTALNYAVLSKLQVQPTDLIIFTDWVVCWALAWWCATVMSRFKWLKPLVT